MRITSCAGCEDEGAGASPRQRLATGRSPRYHFKGFSGGPGRSRRSSLVSKVTVRSQKLRGFVCPRIGRVRNLRQDSIGVLLFFQSCV